MKNIVIFGAPGSGKGTQSDLLIKEYNLAHISTGDVLRAEMKAGTPLGKTAEGYIKEGKLVPDSIIIDMLRETLLSLDGDKAGVIFDGFPRTIAQAEELDKMLAAQGESVTCVIGLEVDEEELIQRIILRGQTSGRSDDNHETVKKRLDTYNNQTLPLRDYYIRQGKYIKIVGVGAIDDIFANIKKAIG